MTHANKPAYAKLMQNLCKTYDAIWANQEKVNG
ncbi:MAG: hypothetical protein ACI9HB_002593 [Gammaproteobacteria bacterium]|jgi:hypothetical protein